MPTAALTELLQEHVVASLLKQQRLRDAFEEAPTWSADLEAGTFAIGDRAYPADVIGTESQVTRTFLWGWANPSTPQHSTAESLRRLGNERGIPELTDAGEMPFETLNAGVAGLIASGVADLDGYYLAMHDERAVVFAIRDEELRRDPVPLIDLFSSFLEVASTVAFSHRRAFAHYLANPLPQVPAKVEGGRAVLRSDDMAAAIRFDHEGRVADVRVEAPGSG